jgi:polysaccharide biosynthesis protein PslA
MLAPFFVLIAFAIRLREGGPVLFRQNRAGKDGRTFTVFKFRTMVLDAEEQKAQLTVRNEFDGIIFKIRRDPRVTRTGAWLRRYSLDELPQLFNVLRGELSLVGPRPHAVSMRVKQRRNEDIVPDYALRHHVKPGITGWAQVNGYHGPVETEKALHERVAYDIDYINNWSLWFDIRILLRTLIIAFGKRHAY